MMCVVMSCEGFVLVWWSCWVLCWSVMLRESLPDRSVSLAIKQARMILNNKPDLNNREEKADLRKYLVSINNCLISFQVVFALISITVHITSFLLSKCRIDNCGFINHHYVHYVISKQSWDLEIWMSVCKFTWHLRDYFPENMDTSIRNI